MHSAQRFDIFLTLALLGIAASSSAIPVMPPTIGELPDGFPPPPPGASAGDCGPGIIDTLAGGAVGDGGPAADATLHLPVGIAAGSDGSLYVADASGYRIRKVDAGGTITTVAGTGHAGDVGEGALPTEAGLDWPTSVAVGADGSLYIADRYHHRIRKVDPGGAITTVAGTGAAGYSGDGGPAIRARLNSPYRVAVAPDGTVYISDTYNRRIRKVDRAGVITTIAGGAVSRRSSRAVRANGPDDLGDGGPATEATLWNPYGLALGPDGSIYIADSNNGRIRKVDRAGIITTVAGTGDDGYSGDGGPATGAGLDHPRGVRVGPDGCLYIADTYNSRVRKVSPDGVITTVAGNGQSGYSGDGGPATQAGLQSPEMVVVTAEGSLYIADTYNHRVRKVDAAGIITTVAGGRLGDGGPAAQASLYEPRGIAIGPDGSFYIAEYMGHRVRRIDPDGTITTVAGNDQRGYSGDGGPATQAGLSFPRSVALGPQGELYIAEVGNHRVRKVDAAGIITTVAGTGEEGYSGDGGLATEAKLHGPWGVAVGADGSLYVADRENHRVRRVDAAGIITTVAGNGRAGFAGIDGLATGASLVRSTDLEIRFMPSADGGPATEASLNYPIAVTVADDGTLYIADFHNHRVRKVDAAGIITTVAGNGRQAFGGDGGPATEASMNRPCGLAMGRDGSLYIATLYDHRVRRVDPAGIISTVAGDGEIAYRGDGWPAAEASLSQPSDVAVGTDGSLYIADATNHRIRKVWLRPCDPEVARQRADALRAQAGGSFRGWFEVAELYLVAEDWDSALAAAQNLLAGMSEADEHARLRADVLLGRIHAAKRDDHEARRCWMRVLARARDPILLRQAADALVDLYLRREERHQAIATLNDLRLRTRDRSLLSWIDQRLKEIAGD